MGKVIFVPNSDFSLNGLPNKVRVGSYNIDNFATNYSGPTGKDSLFVNKQYDGENLHSVTACGVVVRMNKVANIEIVKIDLSTLVIEKLVETTSVIGDKEILFDAQSLSPTEYIGLVIRDRTGVKYEQNASSSANVYVADTGTNVFELYRENLAVCVSYQVISEEML